MIILDTNVLSEVLKPLPSERVYRWLADLDPAQVFTTAITHAEILRGIAVLPAGRRRRELSLAIDKMFREQFPGRILPFDEIAAPLFADIVSNRGRVGRPMSQFDGMIAAITQARNTTLATRNVADFRDCGIELVNPWA